MPLYKTNFFYSRYIKVVLLLSKESTFLNIERQGSLFIYFMNLLIRDCTFSGISFIHEFSSLYHYLSLKHIKVKYNITNTEKL